MEPALRVGGIDFDRAEAIGTFWGHPKTREFGELLIDLEEDKAARRWSSASLRRWSKAAIAIALRNVVPCELSRQVHGW
jgi:hypothetical protein